MKNLLWPSMVLVAFSSTVFFLGYKVGREIMATEVLEVIQRTDSPAPSIIRTAAERNGIEKLVDAIEYIESECNPDAIGDNGNAVGSFQIWKIYVDDCNRICGRDVYTYEDRYSREISRIMVTGWLTHYGGTFEEMARKHNGGPQGHKKESTKPYWEKVKARMENN